MKFPLRSDQWPYFGIAFAFLLTAGIGLSYQTSGLASTLASDSHAEGEYFVDPESAEIDLGGSYTFTTYTETSTDSVVATSDWRVEREGEDGSVEVDPTDIWLEDCDNSSDCTIHAGAVSGDLSIIAERDDETVEATLTISDEWGDNPYTDEIPEWAEPYVYILRDRGLMTGYADGRFGPADSVTRGQFTLLYYRIMRMAYTEVPEIVDDCDLYNDLASDHYAYEAVCFASYAGWFETIEIDDNFYPDQYLTRQEAALIMANAFFQEYFLDFYIPTFGVDLGWIVLNTVFDYPDIVYADETSSESIQAIALMYYFGLMTGTEEADGYRYFYPDREINRAETAVIFGRFVDDLDL